MMRLLRKSEGPLVDGQAVKETSTRVYQYLPLETARTIRIIALYPAKKSVQTLKCMILRVSLDDPPPYESLSYEWKNETPQRAMQCEDGSIILLTPNCHAALTRLRHKSKYQLLWVDAICINQSDTEERNSQVAMMSEIYKSSIRTLVWLGEGDQDSDLAMEFASRATLIYRHKWLLRLLPKSGLLSGKMLGTGRSKTRYQGVSPYHKV